MLWIFLTSDYLSVYYLLSIGGCSVLLLDLLFNRGRVSTVIARAFWLWPV